MTITPDDLVRREVGHCVSALVSTLAGASGMAQSAIDAKPEVWSLINQAAELSYPLDDYEDAAAEEGWQAVDGLFVNHREETTAENASPADACGWEDLCREFDIEPHSREVFEHWIVSDWLADELEAKGERSTAILLA